MKHENMCRLKLSKGMMYVDIICNQMWHSLALAHC